jgi:nicotinate-nucleotide adenylyltransferase
MRIGILGGTFDPPHIGHLTLARTAKEELGLDEVIFMPVNRNPLKKGKSTPAKHRLEMVQRAIADEPGLAMSDIEITRGGLSYAVDTLTELTFAQPGDYWFLVGADALKGLPQWKQPERLLRLARFGVAVRPPIIEADVMARLPEEVKKRIDIVKMSALDVSSTDVRDLISAGKPVGSWVKPTVLQYIRENRLYLH